MHRLTLIHTLVAAIAIAVLVSLPASAQDGGGWKPVDDLLGEGKLDDAERLLAVRLEAKPGNDEARFALGIVQVLRAVETRMQVFHRHGYRSEPGSLGLRMSNLPIPPNPRPEALDYKTARAVLQGWIDDLARLEASLAKVKSADVKVYLRFGMIRMDFDGDGKANDDETLWKVYGRFNGRANLSAEAAAGFVIGFDRGDIDWLRGYCHVLSALTEMLLAHDFEALFDQSGFLLFRGIKPPQSFLVEQGPPPKGFDVGEILDLVAMIHLVRLPVAEPARLKAALGHMEAMVGLSRTSWKFILAETDDDHEWVPNPKQASVIPNVRVTAEMVDGWRRFLDEFEAILAGKKLIPFWRPGDGVTGINVRKVFSEPRAFDLILWVQGTAASPYLEKGDLSTPDTWNRITRVFGGEFIGFALWFN